jgi:hypothetical protein
MLILPAAATATNPAPLIKVRRVSLALFMTYPLSSAWAKYLAGWPMDFS